LITNSYIWLYNIYTWTDDHQCITIFSNDSNGSFFSYLLTSSLRLCSRSCSSHPYSVRSRACARRTLMRSARRREAQLGKQS